MGCKLIKLKPEHISYVEQLRPADKAEIMAAGASDLGDIVPSALGAGGYHFTIMIGSKFMGFVGVTADGFIWMMTTPELIDKYRKDFHKVSKRFLSFAKRKYPLLSNVIWSGNTVHINWITKLGFTVLYDQGFDIGTGETFFPFYMTTR